MSQNEKKEAGFQIVDAGTSPHDQEKIPQMDFSTLVLSLSTSGLMHLGMAPDLSTGQVLPRNIPLARQTADTLEILREKTLGNLTHEEAKLLNQLLYELRIKIVEAEG